MTAVPPEVTCENLRETDEERERERKKEIEKERGGRGSQGPCQPCRVLLSFLAVPARVLEQRNPDYAGKRNTAPY